MKHRTSTRSRHKSPSDEASIDALYGLEPVFDPERALNETTGGLAPFASVQCPYCGEPFDTRLDLSAGSASYIEDCHICCQAIEFSLTVTADGALDSLELRRSD
jgi:hypothetical protein